MTYATQTVTGSGAWFRSWFDSVHYHKLYAYRNDAEAAGFLDQLLRRLRPERGSRMLDVGCGAGRHSKYLASRGFCVTGIDLAFNSIKQAKTSENPRLRFVQHDMRVPFTKGRFDWVLNVFTSFGYFDSFEENENVVRNMADCVKTGGTLVLDYLNVAYAEANLVRHETKANDGLVYRLTRRADGDHFLKRIVIEDPQTGERVEHQERVAKFRLEDFQRMFAAHGLRIDQVYGDYRLSRYEWASSPRLILIAEKAERRECVGAKPSFASNPSESLPEVIRRVS